MSADSFRSSYPFWLGGLWIVALTVRLLYLVELSDSPLWLVEMGDARAYDSWARDLAAGDWLGSEVFYQAPLYPYFLGVIYATVGDEPFVVRLIQSLLGATGCVFLAIAGARLITRRVGLTAGLMLAVYPPAIFFDGILQKTTLTSFLLCCLVAVIAGLVRRPNSVVRWIGAGVLTGFLSLARENAQILVLLTPVWITMAFGRPRFPLRRESFEAGNGEGGLGKRGPVPVRKLIAWSAAFLVGTAAVLVPVAVRNGVVGGEWHLTTSQFGPNFFIGNNRDADGFYYPLLPDRGDAQFERQDAVTLAEQDLGRTLSPRQVSRYWTSRAFEDIAADPGRWIRLLFRKLWLVFGAMEVIDTEDQYTYAEYSTLLSLLTRVWHMGVLVPAALFGAVLLLPHAGWRRRLAWPTIAIFGYAATVVLFFVLGRYRYPLAPPLMLFAAAGLWQAVRIARRRIVFRSGVSAFRRSRINAAMSLRLGVALLAAAVVAVPTNILPYSIEHPMSITRENLGDHLYAGGFPSDMAVAEYERAVELAPNDATIRANFARVLWDLGRLEEAQEHLELAVEDAPEDPAILVELGLLFRQRGETESASERLREAVKVAPEASEPPYHLAVTLLMMADQAASDAVAVALDRGAALPDEPESMRSINNRAEALRSEAEQLLRRSIDLEDSEAAHAVLGRLLARRGDEARAANEFDAAAKRAPEGSARQAQLRHLVRRYAREPDVTESDELTSPD